MGLRVQVSRERKAGDGVESGLMDNLPCRAFAALVLCIAASASASAREDVCAFEGEAIVRGVSPRRVPSMRIDVFERVRLRMDAASFTVQGLDPIRFEGTAPLSGVEFSLIDTRGFGGVLRVGAGARVRIESRARGRNDAVLIQPVLERFRVSSFELKCDALTLASSDREADFTLPDEPVVYPRKKRLRLAPRANATPTHWVETTGDAFDLPLVVVQKDNARLRVQATLSDDVLLDAWVDAKAVAASVREGAWKDESDGSGCGFGYAEPLAFRGRGVVLQGAELLDDEERPFATVVRDTEAQLAVFASKDGKAFPVVVESLQGLLREPCGTSVAQVARSAVRWDEAP